MKEARHKRSHIIWFHACEPARREQISACQGLGERGRRGGTVYPDGENASELHRQLYNNVLRATKLYLLRLFMWGVHLRHGYEVAWGAHI